MHHLAEFLAHRLANETPMTPSFAATCLEALEDQGVDLVQAFPAVHTLACVGVLRPASGL